MRFMITGRGHGKTTRMIKWLHQNPAAIMVCHDSKSVERLQHENPLVTDRIEVYTNIPNVLRGNSKYQMVGIDNLDLILHRILQLPPPTDVRFITATGESDNG